MNGDRGHKDLLVLAADLDIEQAIRGLLVRPHSLNIAEVDFEVRRHPGRDSGCRSGAVEFLRSFLQSYRYALVVFDLYGSGNILDRKKIRDQVEDGLSSVTGFRVGCQKFDLCKFGKCGTTLA